MATFPAFQTYNIYSDESPLVTSSYNKKKGILDIFAHSTPEQKQMRDYFNKLFDLSGNDLLNTSQDRAAQVKQYGDAIFDEITNPLKDWRDSQLLQSKEAFNRAGLLNSSALADYNKRTTEDTYLKGLSSAGLEAILGREQLASSDEARLLQKLQLSANALGADINTQLGFSDAGRAGVATTNDIYLQDWNVYLQQKQLELQEKALKAQIDAAKHSGGFGSILGGVLGAGLGSLAGGFGSAIGGKLGGFVGGLF